MNILAENNKTALSQNTDFLKHSFLKAVFPCMLATLSANINIFVDGILVGQRLGENALAAINLCLPLYLFFCVFGSLITAGTSVAASNEIGKGDEKSGIKYYRTAVFILLIISTAITFIGLVFYKNISSLLCADINALPFVYEYVFITFIGTIPKIMIYIPAWYLRLDGNNNGAAVTTGVMTFGNIVLDFVFVWLLDYGVFGAGLASVIATTIAVILGFVFLESKKSTFRLKLSMYTDFAHIKNIFELGMTSALNNLFSTVRILLVNFYLMKMGGANYVAIFTALCGITGFAECIVLGVPQACNPMLGVFAGEKDNGSSKLLIKIEAIYGAIFAGLFSAIIILGSDFIKRMYGLESSILMPIVLLAISMFPSLFCMILSGYYNMSGHNLWSWMILSMRLIVMTLVSLLLQVSFDINPFFFLLGSELFTLLVWFILVTINHRLYPDITWFLLMDTRFERDGKVFNFSIDSSNESICDASERISDFCATNGLTPKQTMTIQLALEEIMTLIVSVNATNNYVLNSFELRAYSIGDVHGIRIRYGGIEFDPFKDADESDDMNMGIMMVRKIVEIIDYRRTFGVNNLAVVLKGK